MTGDFNEISTCVRRDLLRILTSPSSVRADVIRQFYERGDEGMVDILAELETDDLLRIRVIQALHQGSLTVGLGRTPKG